METNWRRIIIYLLIFLTIVAIVVAVVLSLNLTGGGGPTPTPTPSVTITTTATPSTDPATCEGKGSTRVSVKCRKDDSSVCPGTNGSDAIQNTMVGQEVCGNDDVGKCGFYEACAPTVQEGMACNSAYPGLNLNLKNLSSQSFDEGQFVGCDVNNQANNCFCGDFTSGSEVSCVQDERVNNYYNFCGARTFSGGVTQTPTVTVTGSVSPTPSVVCPTAPTCPSGQVLDQAPAGPDGCITFICISSGTITTTPTTTATVTPSLPDTALTGSDELDRIILAILLIVAGGLVYYYNLHNMASKFIIKLGGKELFNSFEPFRKRQIEEDKENFEDNLRNS